MKKIIKNKIFNVSKYIALSFKINFSNGISIIIWLLLLIFPSILQIFDTKVNAGLIDSFAALLSGAVIQNCYIWLIATIIVRGLSGLLNKVKFTVFDRFARESDRKMALYSVNRVASLDQLCFDSAIRFDDIKGALGSELSLWNLNWQLVVILSSLITIFGSIIILSANSIIYVLIAFIASVPTVLISIYLSKVDSAALENSRRYDHSVGYYESLFTDPATVKELKLFSAFKSFIENWKKVYTNRYNSTFRYDLKSQLLTLTQKLIELTFFIITMGFIAFDTWFGRITIGDFYLYTTNFTLLYSALSEISGAIRNAFSLSDEYDRFEKFTKATSNGEREGDSLPVPDKCNIIFDHVCFSYDNNEVLHDISFELKNDESIALIGRNGSGKSTLIKLLCGLYTPDSGEIYINGKPISRYRQRDIYKLFGIVYQDFNKFQLSLRENLAAQRLDAIDDDAALWKVYNNIDLGNISLTNGLDSQLGRKYADDGIELSGGQWQKIAIARCEFGNRLCRIFDEPASALDSKSENKFITEVLLCNCQNTIIISHRLSVGKLTDKVIYLDEGRIIEQGSHSDLMNRHGEYAKMYAVQAGIYKKEENDT